MDYTQHFKPDETKQTEKARADQVENRAGGFVFAVDMWTMLDRFVILGSEGPTYYATEREMTRANAQNAIACIAADGPRAVARIAELSDSGRAPKNDAAIFALALAAVDDRETTRAAAYAALPKVCRIGTHLFQFLSTLTSLRGKAPGGAGIQRAIERWYADKDPEKLAYQVVKYQNREKWSHLDALRLAHATPASPDHAAIFEWVRAGNAGFEARTVKRKALGREQTFAAADRSKLPAILAAYDEMKAAKSPAEAVKLIEKLGFTREMIPTQHLNAPEVWDALLVGMPMTAMIRNLGKMTAVGLVKPLSVAARTIAERFGDRERLRKARVHPITLLSALKVYEQGHGERGSLTWAPDRQVIDALNDAFYLAFETIEPTGKNWLLGIDISGSMDGGVIAGLPGITPRIAAAAMAMVTARTEKNWHAVGFTSAGGGWESIRLGLTPLNISPRQRLDDVIAEMRRLPMGATDCAMPVMYALDKKIPVDVFATYTDNETFAGPIHVFEAMKRYRRSMNPTAKLAAVAFTATDYSIADPKDPAMMNFVGCDSAMPQILADFARS